MDETKAVKSKYTPPTIQRIAPFFSGSPAKVPGFIDNDVQPGTSGSSFASLTQADWETNFDARSDESEHG